MHGHIYAQELLIGANGQNGNWSRKIPIKKKKNAGALMKRVCTVGHGKLVTSNNSLVQVVQEKLKIYWTLIWRIYPHTYTRESKTAALSRLI